ncbi:MAG: DNA internalization-related competence protein ComEC/Rec2 [Gammaproteobacteria bacterium]
MFLRTIAFLTGIITLSFQSQLFPLAISYSFILLSPLLLFKKRYITLAFCFSAGFIWATVVAQNTLQNKIASELEGKDIVVTGIISSLPEQINRRTKFELSVNTVTYNNRNYSSPKKITLNWYGKSPKLIPNDKWQLVVRLKKPNGYQNPGGFDYEAWIFQNGIDAKGYVRKNNLNKLLDVNQSSFSFTRMRYSIKQKLEATVAPKYRPIILALLIGDKSEINNDQWRVFRKTGTSHLIAISGLHIGLIAALVFFISRWLWGYYSIGVEIIPSPKVAAILAIISAVIYSGMAGFSLPTQRALIMLCVIMISILLDVRAQSWKTLAIALLLVLIFSPFAVMNPGFWLSFFAVAVILYFSKSTKFNNKLVSSLYSWGLIQLVIAIGLLPFVLLFFKESSIISPIANLVIVPVFSFIIVPLVFIAGCLVFIFPFLSKIFFSIVIFILDKVWFFLEYLSELNFASFQINYLTVSAFLLACIGVGLVFLPKKFPTKYLAPVFFIPIFFSKITPPDFGTAKITLLDVGQGLSAVIQTQRHTLVYDTGPRYSESFNTGRTVVIPFLKISGISKVDTIIISHGDNDHIGGLKSIIESIEVDSILTSVTTKVKSRIRKNKKISIENCYNDNQWLWDGIKFQIIHPGIDSELKNNNASCVLKVSTIAEESDSAKQTYSILLTGDIEAEAESEIIDNDTHNIKSNIVIAPHHGSKTSSTEEFVTRINPDYVLYPVGYRNRYQFPTDVVSQRYRSQGVAEYSTSEYGAISFDLNASKLKKPELYRVSQRRFWHN